MRTQTQSTGTRRPNLWTRGLQLLGHPPPEVTAERAVTKQEGHSAGFPELWFWASHLSPGEEHKSFAPLTGVLLTLCEHTTSGLHLSLLWGWWTSLNCMEIGDAGGKNPVSESTKCRWIVTTPRARLAPLGSLPEQPHCLYPRLLGAERRSVEGNWFTRCLQTQRRHTQSGAGQPGASRLTSLSLRYASAGMAGCVCVCDCMTAQVCFEG